MTQPITWEPSRRRLCCGAIRTNPWPAINATYAHRGSALNSYKQYIFWLVFFCAHRWGALVHCRSDTKILREDVRSARFSEPGNLPDGPFGSGDCTDDGNSGCGVCRLRAL